MKKTVIAFLLALCLCFSLSSMSIAWAETAAETEMEDEVLQQHQMIRDGIKVLVKEKKYDEAIASAEIFLADYPDSPIRAKMEKTCIQAYVGKAQGMIDSKQREDAQYLLENCIDQYQDSEYVEIAETALKSLKDLLKAELPKSGAVFHDRTAVHGGYGKLIINNSGKRTLVKIEKASGKDKGSYITMFVRSDGKAEVNIQPGEYLLKYAMGTTWYSTKEWFGSETEYYQADTVLEFAKLPYYSTYTVTLEKVVGGNLATYSIDPSDF